MNEFSIRSKIRNWLNFWATLLTAFKPHWIVIAIIFAPFYCPNSLLPLPLTLLPQVPSFLSFIAVFQLCAFSFPLSRSIFRSIHEKLATAIYRSVFPPILHLTCDDSTVPDLHVCIVFESKQLQLYRLTAICVRTVYTYYAHQYLLQHFIMLLLRWCDCSCPHRFDAMWVTRCVHTRCSKRRATWVQRWRRDDVRHNSCRRRYDNTRQRQTDNNWRRRRTTTTADRLNATHRS